MTLTNTENTRLGFHSSRVPTLFALAIAVTALHHVPAFAAETLAEISTRASIEFDAAYEASPYSSLSKNYFLRFSRDPDARAGDNEIEIETDWSISINPADDALATLMAGYLREFLDTRMQLALPLVTAPNATAKSAGLIVLDAQGGGDPGVAESFTISAGPGRIAVIGHDSRGLRDGVVRLVDQIGFRQAPFVSTGEQVYRPKLSVRLGTVPKMGSYRELVFLGYNAVFAGGGNLHALSVSDAIPELRARRVPGLASAGTTSAAEARRHGLKTYAFVDTRQKFPKDDPVFEAHPDIRGALTWKADGEYVLCTEHPLVRRYLMESVEGLFRADPELDGLVLIIGGEGFYHCFMRPYGVEKGHTNCSRCEPLGAETVVANLCNALATAARSVNPNAEVVAWPYSAEHVWSADKAQAVLIEKFEPGAAIFTEIEKDEYVSKEDGVNKHLWDYSIDLIGPGARAKAQIEACRSAGIHVYLKSEPELAFEAPRLPHIPCMDRWVDRAQALASCGADGAWVFPAFRACFGTSAAEINKFFWWDPAPDKEDLLQRFAARLAGAEAGPHVRQAWKYVSDAIAYSPELPSYYTGPYYLGPAHPMCADPRAELPEVFFGYYLFMAEIADAEGTKSRPTFVKSPTGNVPVFGKFYRRMEDLLRRAVDEMELARPLVPERLRLTFEAEDSPTRWFYHTARTEANFYESCQLRDALLELADGNKPDSAAIERAREMYARWREVLADERANAQDALGVMEADVRLDFRYGGDHTFSHGADMIRAKLELLDKELDTFLPSVAKRIGPE
ncbi:MAG: hypothetical protein AAB353_03775 [Candidatus Hydrogenedentota bacterium]